jgi:transposase
VTEIDKLYTAVLGLQAPWRVERVETELNAGEVHVWVALPKGERWVCPECLAVAPIHDHQDRQWRHLDTCQFKTVIHARVPRLNCPTHGIRQLAVPWGEPGSQFTAMFEALAIDWLKQASVSAVAKYLRISWDEAAGIQGRAVKRGLARREAVAPRFIGIDETAFQKRHEYVTVVSDLERGVVLDVADDRKQTSLDGFWQRLTPEQRGSIEGVAMDMWAPYVQSTREHLPGADAKIVFDKFHVAQHLNVAVDLVRRSEHRKLLADGFSPLTRTKYDWLKHPGSTTHAEKCALAELRGRVERLGRAWALKETAMAIFDLKTQWAADRNFRTWLFGAMRSKLEPIKHVARMLRKHWGGLRNYFVHRITNAGAEAMNAKIQQVKARSRGFRNRERFRNAIYFHCGGLDLYPAGIRRGQ